MSLHGTSRCAHVVALCLLQCANSRNTDCFYSSEYSVNKLDKARLWPLRGMWHNYGCPGDVALQYAVAF